MSTYPYPPTENTYGLGGISSAPKNANRNTLNRTPSPTPSEQAALADDGKENAIKKAWENGDWKKLAGIAVLVVLVVLMIVFQEEILDALEPAAKWMRQTTAGFLIPIAILIVLSIPPLFGHEIVLLLVGFTWGIGPGFAIGAAGTIIGELLTFCVFSFMCTGRLQKFEQSSIDTACIARVLREGGWKIALISRYSTIPGHMLTALFASCGMTLVTFLLAATLSLPKQLATVYLGYALTQKNSTKIIKYLVLGVTVIVTVFAMRYISKKQTAVKPLVIYERRKRRQAQLHSFASSESLERGDGVPLFHPKPQGAYKPL